MQGVNKAIIVGHLGRDPTIRETKDGKKIASFSVATSKSWTDKATGEKKSSTDWHNVVVFNDGLAKVVEQYLKKGAPVYIEGEMKTRKYKGNDGIEKYTTEVVLQGFGGDLQMLGSSGNKPPPPDENAYASGPSESAPLDDEIPL